MLFIFVDNFYAFQANIISTNLRRNIKLSIEIINFIWPYLRSYQKTVPRIRNKKALIPMQNLKKNYRPHLLCNWKNKYKFHLSIRCATINVDIIQPYNSKSAAEETKILKHEYLKTTKMDLRLFWSDATICKNEGKIYSHNLDLKCLKFGPDHLWMILKRISLFWKF